MNDVFDKVEENREVVTEIGIILEIEARLDYSLDIKVEAVT